LGRYGTRVRRTIPAAIPFRLRVTADVRKRSRMSEKYDVQQGTSEHALSGFACNHTLKSSQSASSVWASLWVGELADEMRDYDRLSALAVKKLTQPGLYADGAVSISQ
jgi:hypothetical protein